MRRCRDGREVDIPLRPVAHGEASASPELMIVTTYERLVHDRGFDSIARLRQMALDGSRRQLSTAPAL